jgi:DNA/RNA-binding protein KIN17
MLTFARLETRHNTQRVRANAVYNEYIQDKHHIHMNSTKWVTLTEFIKYMGREGLVRVDENEKGFWIQWVDNSPKALARQAEMQKRERADMDDEQRQRRQLREQMERLQRAEGEKVSLSLNLGGLKPKEETVKTEPEDTVKTESEETVNSESAEAVKNEPTSPLTPAVTPAVTTTDTAKVKTEPAPNPLKRAAPTNIFKTSSKSSKSNKESTPSSTPKSHLAGKKFLTAAERLMLEDQARAGRKHSGASGGYQGMGPSRR